MSRKWLVDILSNKNLTQTYVAHKSQITRSYFSQIVSGRRRPSPDVAKRIANVLGFPANWYKLLEKEQAQ